MSPWHLEEKLGAALAMTEAHLVVRASLVNADRLALSLGRPNREQVVTVRSGTATTLQAMELTNGDTLNSLIKRGAEKLRGNAAEPPARRLGHLYEQALGRKPTPTELQLATELVGNADRVEPLEDFLWSLAMLPEFQLIY